jgi:hypothetical protein
MRVAVAPYRVFLVLLGWTAAVGTATGQPPQVDRAVIDEIKRAAPGLWQRATTTPFTSVVKSRTTDTQTDAPRNATTTRLAVDGPNYLWVREPEGADPSPRNVARVQVTNTKYAFRLTRRTGETDWVLSDWKMAGEEKPNFTPIRYPPEGLDTFAHLVSDIRPLSELLASPSLVISRAEISPDDPNCVRLHISHTNQPQPKVTRTFQGWVDLDRTAGWCIKREQGRSGIQIENDLQSTDSTVTHEYVIDRGIPVLTKTEWVGVRQPSGKGGAPTPFRRVITLETTYRDSVPVQEFTLTAFGLPEPVGVVWEKPIPTYVWLLAAAGGCGLLAILFRWFARRGKASTPPAPMAQPRVSP